VRVLRSSVGRSPRIGCTPCSRRTCPSHIDIHHDARHAINAVGRHFGILLDGTVANMTRKLDDPVMYLDPNRSGYDTLFTIKLGNDLFLYLHIVLH
jgi:hypothetical protein